MLTGYLALRLGMVILTVLCTAALVKGTDGISALIRRRHSRLPVGGVPRRA